MTIINEIAAAAAAKADLANLQDGIAYGEINGQRIMAQAVPIKTQSKKQVSIIWYIDGKRASKAKVEAL